MPTLDPLVASFAARAPATVQDLRLLCAEFALPFQIHTNDNLVITLPNAWVISIGYGTGHYGANKFAAPDDDIGDQADNVELAIFYYFDGPYFIPEDADPARVSTTDEGDQSFYDGWVSIARVAAIIDQIAGMAPAMRRPHG